MSGRAALWSGQGPLPLWSVRTGEKYLILRERGEAERLASLSGRAHVVLLVPLRTLSVHPFSFPFGNVARIREALALQYRSLLVGGGGVEILPMISKREGKGASGAAWIWAGSESESRPTQGGGRVQIWPLPLALAAETGGNGVALVRDAESVSAIAFRDGMPYLSRLRAGGAEVLEKERAWFRRALGEDVRFAEIDISGERPEELHRFASLAARTWVEHAHFRDVDLSPGGVDAAMAWDRALSTARMPLAFALVAGLVVLGGAFLHQRALESYADEIDAKSREVFSQVFGPGNVSDPLSQAKARLAALQGGGEEGRRVPLAALLAFVAESWKAVSPDVVAETLGYAENGAQLVGSAPDVGALAPLREGFAKAGGGKISAQIDDVQQIPGGSIRFSANVKWGAQ